MSKTDAEIAREVVADFNRNLDGSFDGVVVEDEFVDTLKMMLAARLVAAGRAEGESTTHNWWRKAMRKWAAVYLDGLDTATKITSGDGLRPVGGTPSEIAQTIIAAAEQRGEARGLRYAAGEARGRRYAARAALDDGGKGGIGMDAKREYQTLCPECGWGVPVDEDGCCTSCGAPAHGDGVDTVAAQLATLRACVEAADALADTVDVSGPNNTPDGWRALDNAAGAYRRARAALEEASDGR
jgi:hypothetical protein